MEYSRRAGFDNTGVLDRLSAPYCTGVPVLIGKPSQQFNRDTKPFYYPCQSIYYCTVMCMGSGYVYHCPDCGEATYIALGVGSEYTPQKIFYGDGVDPPLIQDFLSNPLYRKANRLLQSGGVPDTTHRGSYGQKLYYCPRCRTLKVKFFCTITKEDLSWNPAYSCEFCGLPLILAPHQENGDDPSRNQMEGAGGEVLRIHCMNCGRVYFAPECASTSKINLD